MEAIGICKLCKSDITRKGRNMHLNSCIKNNCKTGNDLYFQLSIEGRYDSQYWLNILIKKTCSLKLLDDFLRDLWLECCGHLSAFEINGQSYSVSPAGEFDEKSMNYKIGRILHIKDTIHYTYDFGSSTELTLNVFSEYSLDKNNKNIEILARNKIPKIKCSECNKIATNVCCECLYEDGGWLCDDCSEKHECGEDMLLPVVNSPRVGVCAYCG